MRLRDLRAFVVALLEQGDQEISPAAAAAAGLTTVQLHTSLHNESLRALRRIRKKQAIFSGVTDEENLLTS